MAVSKIDNGLQDQINDLNSNLRDDSIPNLSIIKTGQFCSVHLWGTITLKSDGMTVDGTISSGFRPKSETSRFGKVWNGSTYVDCKMTISTSGVIKITDLSSGKINNIDTKYFTENNIVYRINDN